MWLQVLKTVLFLLLLSVSHVSIAQTATDDFTIRVFVGEDTEPPSTPVLLSATAVSPSQVDLSWSTATDNFVLGGYVLSRDGSPIATTTLTTFSDAGLTALTTYDYSVRAFDSAGNYSSSSNILTVVTPSPPIITDTAVEGTITRVQTEDIEVVTDKTNAYFTISTVHPARFTIRWGRTAAYESGFISSDIVRKKYQTVISELEPGTEYHYEIVGFTPSGRLGFETRGTFTTTSDIDLTAPPNVLRFTAQGVGNDVQLKWHLPEVEDVSYVRVVRSHLSFPLSPTEGAVVYQGHGSGAVDEDVLSQYSPAYYTAFVYDRSGNISSGAIAIAFASDFNGSTGTEEGSLDPLASTTQLMPDAFEILIRQADQTASFGDNVVFLSKDEPFLLHLSADQVTRNVKSIIVQLQDPIDQRKSFSFLLRLNKDGTAYEAVVAPVLAVGESSLMLSIYDFRALRVAEYRTRLTFEEVKQASTAEDMSRQDAQLLNIFIAVVIGLLLVLVGLLIKRDR